MEIADFHFLRPFWFGALIPLALLIWLYSQRSRSSSSWEAVCDPQLLPHILLRKPTKRHRLVPFSLVLCGLLGITALAGPTWERLPQPVYRDQSALVIVLDLSRSMDATDIKPSRLARARFKIADILRQRSEGQTALLVFAGDVFTVTPLTDDTQTIVSQLSILNTSLPPLQGSRIDLALEKAGELLRQTGLARGDILLITDGSHDKRARKVARGLIDDGYRLSVLGIGTPQGAPIPLQNGEFLKDSSGAIVLPKLDSESLKELARMGMGRYETMRFDDQDIQSLSSLLSVNRLQDAVDETELKADLWHEQGPWLILLVIPWAALVFRRGYLVLLPFFFLPLTHPAKALGWDSLWLRPDQQASQAFDAGDAQQAAKRFNDPAWKGVAHYRAGDYEGALQSLEALNDANSSYNKGNALARLGRYPEAIKAYEEALKLEPNHEDARYNRGLVQQALNHPQQHSQNQPSADKQNSQQGQDEQQRGEQSEKTQDTEQQDASNQSEQSEGYPQPKDNQAPQPQASDDPTQTAEAQQLPSQSELAQSPQAQQPQEQNPQQPLTSTDPHERSHPQPESKDESQLATEQWLRRIPDDPGGLLRRKFHYQYQRRSRPQAHDTQPW